MTAAERQRAYRERLRKSWPPEPEHCACWNWKQPSIWHCACGRWKRSQDAACQVCVPTVMVEVPQVLAEDVAKLSGKAVWWDGAA